MSKILLCVSERWTPDPRVEAVADFALGLKASILLIHVAYGTETSGMDVSPGERTLESLGNRLKAKEVKVETLLLFSDDIATAILKTAEEHQCSLVMLGLSSKGVLARLIEGSVSQEVIKNTRLPILLLPPEWKGRL